MGWHRVGQCPVTVEEERVVILEVPHGEIVGERRGERRRRAGNDSYRGWAGFSPVAGPGTVVEVTYG
jgi:hypothetical protein